MATYDSLRHKSGKRQRNCASVHLDQDIARSLTKATNFAPASRSPNRRCERCAIISGPRMANRDTLDKFAAGTDYLIYNRGVPLFTFIHVCILDGTTVPPNVNAVHTSNATRKTSRGVFSNDLSIGRVVKWHVYVALLYGCHIVNPFQKKRPMDLFTDVGACAAHKVRGTSCQNKKGTQNLKLQIGNKFSSATFPILCPFGPKLFIRNIPQFKEDLERNMEEFSKFCRESTVWFCRHFVALWRNQKHFPPQAILLVHARILGSLLLGLGGT